jgi:glycosyltransferase involved in cell wall biosynthesis
MNAGGFNWKHVFLSLIRTCIDGVFVLFATVVSLFIRFFFKANNNSPRIVWGSTPIINNSYWSKAMRELGFKSETFTLDFYSTINRRSDWDVILSEQYYIWPSFLKPYLAFIDSLLRFDVFVISFEGFFLNHTSIWRCQGFLFRLAGKKSVVIPYGADAYVYRRIRSTALIHGLLMSYPQYSKTQKKIAQRVDYWCKWGDVIIPGLMGPDGMGRWEVLIPSSLALNLEMWKQSSRSNGTTYNNEKVVIAHAPNHRGFKGSEFVFDAVEKLKQEGLNVELLVFEKMQNSEVRKHLEEDVDILVEQLIFTGHGLNGLEGMASGITTISNLEDEGYILPLRRWAYLDECPLVSANPETLVDVLRKLVKRPALRQSLGQAGRAYVEKYHGLDSAQYLFTNVIDYLYGRKESLINLYHPILGEYPNRSPKIQHPLVNNKIVD